MKWVEISGPIGDGMWHYSPYPPVTVENYLWDEEQSLYGQKICFGSQAGTYVAVGSHVHKGGLTVDQIPFERFVSDAILLHIPKGPKGHILLSEVHDALDTVGEQVGKGESVIVATGWESRWNKEDFLEETPIFAKECVFWLLDQEISILGSDSPLWDDGSQSFFFRFYATDTMVLAPLINLTEIPEGRHKLWVFPLKIVGSVGSPCRAFLGNMP